MQVSFALFADAANLSQEGKLNILGVFDAVQVASLPALHPRAHLVVRLKGVPAQAGASHRVTLNWLNPAGNELWSSDGQLDITPNSGPSGEVDIPIIASVDLPLDVPGVYRMRISVDTELRGEVPLHVRSNLPLPAPTGLVS